MDIQQESLKLHKQWKGKIEVVSRVEVKDKTDLSLAYTPGVALFGHKGGCRSFV